MLIYIIYTQSQTFIGANGENNLQIFTHIRKTSQILNSFH